MPRYILLPRRGLRASEPRARVVLEAMWDARSTEPPKVPSEPDLQALGMRVIDSIHEDGPKLVELSEEAAARLVKGESELHVEPERTYRLAGMTPASLNPPVGASSAASLRVQVVTVSGGAPVPGAKVTALTRFAAHEGAEGISDGKGYVDLALGGLQVALEKVYVTCPLAGFWGGYLGPGLLTTGDVLRIEPLVAGASSVMGFFFGPPPPANSRIKVGVIDTGIGPHPDLVVSGGQNTVQGEPRGDIHDNGVGHGTHVAGIIAGDGPTVKGTAPGVTLLSYRAFAMGSTETTNYAILKALIRAVDDDECDIVNLSLAGEARPDPTLDEALKDAKRNGTLVVMAAGNDYRKPIGYPAAYADQTGLVVSAMGRTSCFPTGACEYDLPQGTDPDNFVAPFTNIGSGWNSGAQVSYIAPGVGIISTVPGGYGVMSGTSMAAPAISGMMARILTRDLASANPVLNRARDSRRVVDMIQLADACAVPLGFGSQFEGRGLPR